MKIKIEKLWQKIAIPVLALTAINVIVTLLASGSVAEGANNILSNLYFIEGAILFGLGVLIAYGMSSWRTRHSAGHPTSETGNNEPSAPLPPATPQRDKKKQLSIEWIVTLIGAILLGLSLLTFFVSF